MKLEEKDVAALKKAVRRGLFPGVRLEEAMRFALSGGILPKAGLPTSSFLLLDDWLRSRTPDPGATEITATELKNKTGEILESALQGKTTIVTRHGRAIAEIRPAGERRR